MPANHKYPFLQPLLAQLDAEGFAISMDTLLRIEQILLAKGEQYRANPEGLKEILCPIIANSEPEQVKFNRLFDYYLQQLKASDALPELPLPDIAVTPSRINPKTIIIGLAIAVSLLLLAGSIWLWFSEMPEQDRKEIVPEIPPPVPDDTLKTCKPEEKPPTYFQVSEQSIRAGQEITLINKTQPPKPATYTWFFDDGQSFPANTQEIKHTFTRAGSYGVSLKGSYGEGLQACDSLYWVRITVAASDQKIGLPQMFPSEEFTKYQNITDWKKPVSIVSVWVILLLIILLASLWYDRLKEMAQNIAHNILADFLRKQEAKNAKGGNLAPFQINFPAQDANIEAVQEVYDVATAMRQRQSSEVLRINMAKTIRQTIQSGGIVSLAYNRQSLSTEYLALIDHTCQNDHRARFFENWIDTLTRENVLIEKYFFRQDPRICWNSGCPDGIGIEELARLYPKHRLIVLDDGDYLLNPLRPKLKEWVLPAFETWTKRALVTPADPEHWMYRERLLSDVFVVIPANLQGQAVLAELLSSDEDTDFKKLHTRFMRTQRHAAMPVYSAQSVTVDWEAVKEYLTVPDENGYPNSDLFVLLCALVCFDPITWEVTLAVAKALKEEGILSKQALTHNNLLLLARLPWLQEAYMPDTVKQYLLDQLRNMPQVELIARKAAIELLDSIDLKEDSFARRKKEQYLATQLQQAAEAMEYAKEAEINKVKQKFKTQNQDTFQLEEPEVPQESRLVNQLSQWFQQRLQPPDTSAAPDVTAEYTRQLRNKTLWQKAFAATFPVWAKSIPLFIIGVCLITALGLPVFVLAAIYLIYLLLSRQTSKAAMPAGLLFASLPGVALWLSVLLNWAGYSDDNLFQTEVPSQTAALINNGVEDFYTGNFENAETNFAKVLETDPNNPKATFNLAVTYYAQGLNEYNKDNYEAAIATFKKAAATTDSSELKYNVWHNIGVCQYLISPTGTDNTTQQSTANAPNQALAYYDSLMQANPAYLQRFAPNLGLLLGKQQKMERDFPPRRLPANTPPITAYAISENGQYLFTGHANGHCRLWYLPALTLQESFEVSVGNVTAMAFSVNAHLKAVGGEQGFAVWNFNGDEIINRQDNGGVSDLIFTPDGKQIAVNFKQGKLQFFNLSTENTYIPTVFSTQPDRSHTIALSPSGKTLALINAIGTKIEIWQLQPKQQLQAISPKGYTDVFTALAFSPDGKLLAATTEGGRISLYQTDNSYEAVKNTELKERLIGSIGFSPNSNLLVGMLGYQPTIWNAKTLAPIYEFETNVQLQQAAFSPNGQYIVLQSTDTNRLRLYQTAIYQDAFFEEPNNPAYYLYINGIVKDENGEPVADVGIAEVSDGESMEVVSNSKGEFTFQYPKAFFNVGKTISLELRYPPTWTLVSPKPFKVKLAEQPQKPPIVVTVKSSNNTTEATRESSFIESLRSGGKFTRVADSFKDGLLLVYNENKFFYLNRSGNPAMPGLYFDKAADFDNGRAKVTLNGATYYIDKTGKCVKDCPGACSGVNCGTHGNCNPQTGKCDCKDGYTGTRCQTPPANPCANINCGTHGTCNPQTGKCDCKDGYTGTRCQTPPANPCANINCGTHGTCNPQTGKCDCKDGYTGDKCQTPPTSSLDPCAYINCGTHGKCNPQTGKCICDEGYYGENCEYFLNTQDSPK